MNNHGPFISRLRIGKAFMALTGLCLLAPVLAGCSGDDPSAPVSRFRIVSDVTGSFCSLDNTNCEASIDIPFHIEGGDSAANYTLQLHLDLNADGTVDEDLVVQNVLTGTYPDYLISYTLPIGRHEIVIDVTDGMGKAYSGTIAFEVADCRAPVPICINGLALELQPLAPPQDIDGDGDIDSAAMTVLAADFVAAPSTDCSTPIVYSINLTGETADIAQSSLVLTCDDIGTVLVEIHAWDNASNPLAPQPDGSTGGPNHDFCETYILVQDNLSNCN